MQQPKQPGVPPSLGLPRAAAAVPGDEAGPVPITDPDFVDHVFTYLLKEFPQLAGPKFANAKRAVREELGGERVYVSSRSATERRELAHQVLSLFNGRNATEIARALNISRASVYRVLKQAPRSASN